MNHFVGTAQLRIFILDGVEAVRTSGHNFFDFVAIEHLNVGGRLHLKQKLIARPPRRISGTGFFGAQHGKINVYRVQNFNKTPG